MTDFQPVRRHRRPSLWLEEALAAESGAAECPPLRGSHRADVCVVGGGYTGLWTAIRMKERDPAVDVVVLEANRCGSGASGRNGGLALSWWPKLRGLIKLCGEDEAIRLARAADDAIAEIGRFCTRYAIDAHYRQTGWLWTATAPAHVAAWEGSVRACEQRGIDRFERLLPSEVAARTGSPVHLAGVFEPSAATVPPALLARGLRRIAVGLGVRVFERSAVVRLDDARPTTVRTLHGAVAVERVVLAINAWAASLPDLRRAVLPMSSDMVATAPIPDRLAATGWTGGEAISDARLMVHYYRTTADGRIAFGRAGESHAYLGRVTPALDDLGGRHDRTVDAFRRTYPMLADVPISHRWSGAVDRSATNLPFFGHLSGRPDVVYGVGYSGNGVAPAVLGAKILASAALERGDEWTTSPLNRGLRSLFPPDPVRYVGGILVRSAVRRKEAAEEHGRPVPPPILAIAGMAPSSMHKGGPSRLTPPAEASRAGIGGRAPTANGGGLAAS